METLPEHTARICENGHVLTVSLEQTPDADDFCMRCGSKGIDHCQHCGIPITGIHPIWRPSYTKPQFCHKCGEPYPWVQNVTKLLETGKAKWIRITSLFYWFKFISSKLSNVPNWVSKHNWTKIEIMTIILVVLALATLVSMWIIYWS